jgi:hypothetical protein
MKRILQGKPLDIIAHPTGVVLVLPENDPDTERIKLSFRLYDYTRRKIVNISKDTYLAYKFGTGYREISSQLKDYVSCSTAFYKDRYVHVVFPTGEMGTFDNTGTLLWTGDLTYHDSPVRSCAMDGKYIWCAVPDQNAVVRYSTKLERVDLRVGGINTEAFRRPMSVTRVDNSIYVCSKISMNIKVISLDNYIVTGYRQFSEPVLRYLKSGGKETVVLSSGVYTL